MGDLVLNIENVVKDSVGKRLSEILVQKGYDEKSIFRIQKAICERDFSSIEIQRDQDELKIALGLAFVAERVRSQVFTDTLERLNSEELVSFGMKEGLHIDKTLLNSSETQNAAERFMTEEPIPIVAKWIHQFREKNNS